MPRLSMPLHSYRDASSARLINWYPEVTPPEAKAPVRLIRAPGIASFATGTGAGRGLFVFQEQLYAVSGTNLLRISSFGVVTVVGTIPGADIVSAADNGTQCVIAAGNNGYLTTGTNVAQITDSDFLGAGMVGAIDSYIVANRPNTRQFASSDLADASNWSALYFASAEGSPDPIVGLIVDHREILLAKARTFERWYDAGGSGFPFERSPDGFMQIGCAAGKTLARADNSVFWAADDYTVRRLNGGTPQRISQHGVEAALRSYGDLSQAFGFTATWNGHIWYFLTVPNKGTWCFDVTTGEWHERQSYNLPDWRISGSVSCYGKIFAQDLDTGNVGYFTDSLCTEFGKLRVDDVQFGAIYAEASLISFQGVEARYVCDKKASSAPQFVLFKSDMGSDWMMIGSRSLGGIGAKPRCQWFRLGMSRERVFKLRADFPEMAKLEDMTVDYVVGTS